MQPKLQSKNEAFYSHVVSRLAMDARAEYNVEGWLLILSIVREISTVPGLLCRRYLSTACCLLPRYIQPPACMRRPVCCIVCPSEYVRRGAVRCGAMR